MTVSDVHVQITGIRTVAVPVRDQERALAFYTGVLGLEVRLDAPFGGGRWVEVAPPGGATSLALVTDRPAGIDTGVRLTTADAAAAQRRCTRPALTPTRRCCATQGCRRCLPSVTPTAIGWCSSRSSQSPGSRWCS